MSVPGRHRSASVMPVGAASSLQAVADVAVTPVLVAVAWWCVRSQPGASFLPAHDVYAYYFPNMLYAARHLYEGGGGLLWNPLQNCGEPFLANALVGLFYPPNWVFAALDPDHALVAVRLLNASIATLGCYAFFRQLGARAVTALAGTLTFLIGPMTLLMLAWSPIHLGSYCWLPVALFCSERLLAKPVVANAIVLGVVLTLAFLPGYPQVTLFIYLALAAQVLVKLAIPGAVERWRTLVLVAFAGALPLLLGAVALIPFGEFWRESIRSRPLTAVEIGGPRNPAAVEINKLLVRSGRLPVSMLVGAAALWFGRLRRPAVFFYVTGALVLGAALGSDGPLGDIYAAVPGVAFFRSPERFLWLSDICCAGLIALGLEGVARTLPSTPGMRLGAGAWPWARWLLVAAVLPVAVTWAMLRWDRPMPTILASSESLWEFAASFRELRTEMTPMDRAYLAPPHPFATNFGFLQKSASLFEFPSTFDYEPMTNRRYAEYFVMMRSGATMRKLDDFLLGHYFGGWIPKRFRWPMLNLIAGRYLVFDSSREPPAPQPWLYPVVDADPPGLRTFENRAALPRAFFVSAVEVVRNPGALLRRLASGAVPTDRVALVEAPPASGFVGSRDPAGAATVRFSADEPERIVLDVEAPRRGFLFLSDTYYPGWTAEVDGRSVPIQRANHAFRLVEVPQGKVQVVFRFRPRSLIVGAGISLVSMVCLAAAVLGVPWRRRERPGR